MKRLIGLCGLLTAIAALVSGCGIFPEMNPENPLSFHEEGNFVEQSDMVRTDEMPGTGLKVTYNTFPLLSERDLVSAKLEDTAAGPSIELQFDDHGTVQLDHITTKARDHYLVICIDAKPVAAWYVTKRITDGKFSLCGDFTEAQAKRYVAVWTSQIKKNISR